MNDLLWAEITIFCFRYDSRCIIPYQQYKEALCIKHFYERKK